MGREGGQNVEAQHQGCAALLSSRQTPGVSSTPAVLSTPFHLPVHSVEPGGLLWEDEFHLSRYFFHIYSDIKFCLLKFC